MNDGLYFDRLPARMTGRTPACPVGQGLHSVRNDLWNKQEELLRSSSCLPKLYRHSESPKQSAIPYDFIDLCNGWNFKIAQSENQ
jgi:hypothetical protein